MDESPEDAIDADVMRKLAQNQIYEDAFSDFIEDPSVRRALKDLEIDECDHKYMFDILDNDNTGSLTLFEFMDGLRRLRGNPRRSDIISVDLMVRDIQAMTRQIWELQCSQYERERRTISRPTFGRVDSAFSY